MPYWPKMNINAETMNTNTLPILKKYDKKKSQNRNQKDKSTR